MVEKTLTCMDYYHICWRAKEIEGMSTNQTAALIGCDPTYVSQYLKLGALPHEIQVALASGLIKPSVRVLMKLTELEDGSEAQQKFFQDILDGEKVTLDMVKLAIHEQNLKNSGEVDAGDDVSDEAGDGEPDSGGTGSKKPPKPIKDCTLNIKMIRNMFEGRIGPAEFSPTATFCDWVVTKFLKGHGGTPESPQKFVNAFDRMASASMRAMIEFCQANDIDLNAIDLSDKKTWDNLYKQIRNDASTSYKPSKGEDV
jgi:hypothetical protein